MSEWLLKAVPVFNEEKVTLHFPNGVVQSCIVEEVEGNLYFSLNPHIPRRLCRGVSASDR